MINYYEREVNIQLLIFMNIFEKIKEKGHKTYLEPVERPAAKLEPAGLLVEGEVSDVDITGGLEDGGWLPLDQPVVVQGGLGHRRDVVVTVGTGGKQVIGQNTETDLFTKLYIIVQERKIGRI